MVVDDPNICILLPPKANKDRDVERYYTEGIQSKNVFIEELYLGSGKKPKKAEIVEFMDDLLPVLQENDIEYLLVVEANYFKYLTGATKITDTLGYVHDCVLDYDFKIIYLPNHQAAFYNPSVVHDIATSIDALNNAINGIVKDSNDFSFIHSEHYPETSQEIWAALENLLEYDLLAVDIEGFSLNHYASGVGTISFATSKHEGVAFAVDYYALSTPNEIGGVQYYGDYTPDLEIHNLLRKFFTAYSKKGGKLIFHRANYDTKCIIYTLWMNDIIDSKGMLEGLHTIYGNVEDTRIIAYLLRNSAVRPDLTLKSLAYEYVGKYAQDSEDIKDIRRIPLPELLRYNLVDTLGTFYCYERDRHQLAENNLEYIYTEIMQKSLKVITQMELTGACLDPDKVIEADELLEVKIKEALDVFNNNPLVIRAIIEYREQARIKEWESRKAKAKNPDKIVIKPKEAFDKLTFNPGSPKQMQFLLHDFIGLPVIDTTPTKEPAVGGKTLKKLINHTDNEDIKEVLNILIEYAQATKVKSAFLTKFLEAPIAPDGNQYLFGCFNLGVPVSGRLSSSDP